MKKFYSLLAVAALSLTTAMAQTASLGTTLKKDFRTVTKKQVKADVKLAGTIKADGLRKGGAAVKSMSKAPVSKVATRALAANQKYFGAYSSDSYEADARNGIGLPKYPGELKVGAFLPSELFSNVADSKILGLRFALTNVANIKDVFIYPVSLDGVPDMQNPIATKSFILGASITAGWNEVTFNTPVTVDFTQVGGLLVGYTYNQVASGDASFPISVVNEGDICPTYVYGNLGQGLGWYDPRISNLGNLSVQLLLENDKFLVPDVVMEGAQTGSDWVKPGQALPYAFAVSNFGTSTIGKLEVRIILGEEVMDTKVVENVTGETQVVQGQITIPSNMPLGMTPLYFYAVTADGKPFDESTTTNDAAAVRVFTYNKAMSRQMTLMEQFTSQYCMYCQPGATNLKNFVTSRNNEIAWVAVHGNMPSGDDQFTIIPGNYIMAADAVSGFPSVAFNRTIVDGEIAVGAYLGDYSADVMNGYFEDIVTYVNTNSPALASVNISGSYNKDTRLLTVKVNGNGVDVEQLLSDYALTVYLTEDGIVAPQLNTDGRTWNQNYVHDHVLRASLTAPLGDMIEWNGDAYEKTFTTTLESGWNADNMNVVAFVAPAINTQDFDYGREWVANADCKAVKYISDGTGIKGVYNNGADAIETARYNAAGQVISAPQKGLNIIKMSNGETRKIIVK